jgi:allophanate hydrolase
VPERSQLQFFGDTAAQFAFDAAVERLSHMGAKIVSFDIEPYYETARLLYEGPWIAERYLAIREILTSTPEAVHPVTRAITLGGAAFTAADTFSAFYRLQELRRCHERTFESVDIIALPTAPTVYSVDEVLANPIELNSRLGTYANFVNLLDMCGLAVPAAITPDGFPFGITLLSTGGRDALLASVGRVFHAQTGLPMGALNAPQPRLKAADPVPGLDEVAVVVVGAHMSGMALNDELLRLGARFLFPAATTPDYRLFTLTDASPARPGMLRVSAGSGSPIAVEVWALSTEAFGKFVADVPAPLSIGTVHLVDDRKAKGFLVEAAAIAGARDISAFGGWRSYIASGT